MSTFMAPDYEMENTPFKLPPGYVHFSLNTVNILHLKYAIKFILKCASHGGTMYA